MKAILILIIYGALGLAGFSILYGLISLGLLWFGVPGAVILGVLLLT